MFRSIHLRQRLDPEPVAPIKRIDCAKRNMRPMGVRPLYYCADAQAVSWSTSLGELAVRVGRVDDLDDAFVASWMALTFSTEVTRFERLRANSNATRATRSISEVV